MNVLSPYPVEEFAARAVAAAGQAAAALVSGMTGTDVEVEVDPILAYGWFGMSFAPDGWQLPSPWDSVAGDYRARDGWIRLHTNAPHHRRAALSVLGLSEEQQSEATREAVSVLVAGWNAGQLETAVVSAGGSAAAMHSGAEWDRHPQGSAVAAEPLVTWLGVGQDVPDVGRPASSATPEQPLAGVRVLDLTRVIAGPVSTRFLAGLGAEVLRIDPPGWTEPALEPEMTLGKRTARLDAATTEGGDRLRDLAAQADIVVHGYRPGALARLGLSQRQLQELRPGIVDIGLNAYGWSGPWARRRGFDSVVQMSAGIADAGMAAASAQKPVPLPVQALDHATGYLAAAAALQGWRRRLAGGTTSGRTGRLSLARTATALRRAAVGHWELGPAASVELDRTPVPEQTDLGPGRRLPAPLRFTAPQGVPVPALAWRVPAGPLGRDAAEWDSLG
ncbi:Formyl-coenzyme A transferase [Arthrobacter saudimassiliensis]|uniref:Formyl-coenzyme A transferase n=1 Tax=Arthrobacter saudimassiliensis TaxID=1461584 RepID=A0A078MPR3_9MICC|nr:Formyl-coenzyme A transferase [Arthrobacter saudimassiliensis]